MIRTERQKRADEALDEAIRETNAAYFETEHEGEGSTNYVTGAARARALRGVGSDETPLRGAT